MPTEGRCNCGSIKITVPELPSPALCYCSNCRRSSAGLCSVNYFFDWSDVKVNDSDNLLKSYEDSDTNSGKTIIRQFCGKCGSPVFSLLSPDAPKVIVKGGLFDETSQPGFESFPQDKASWLKFNTSAQGKV